MSIANELIGLELEQFVVSRDRVERLIQEELDYLQARADEGKANPGYVRKMNFLLGSIWEHLETTKRLHQAIGTLHELLGNDYHEKGRLKNQVNELQLENKKLKTWMHARGFDLSLLPWIKESDFRYI